MTDQEKIAKAAQDFAARLALKTDDIGSDAILVIFQTAVLWRDQNPGPDITQLIENFMLIMKRWKAQAKFGVLSENWDNTIEKFGETVTQWQSQK